MENKFITFISKSLSSFSSVFKIISTFAICNPLSTAGKNYRPVLDSDGHYDNKQKRLDWNSTFNSFRTYNLCLDSERTKLISEKVIKSVRSMASLIVI